MSAPPPRHASRSDDGRRPLDGLTVVLPCHDEEANVAAAVAAALRAGAGVAAAVEVVVVDDGSRDGTAAVARRAVRADDRVRLLRHRRNRGYGAAVRTGLAAARMPWVLLTDADLQFDLDELDRFAGPAAGADLVVGRRVARSDPLPRRVDGALWNALVRTVLDVRVHDVDCAFKLIRRELLERLELTSDGAAVSAELLAQAARRGARVAEVGVSHRPRRAGRQSGARPDVVVRALRELAAVHGALADGRPAGGGRMDDDELQAMLDHDEHHWWYRGRLRILRAVLDELALPPDARILDAGCGSGRVLDELARRGSACGIDVSETAVRCAQRRGHGDVRRAHVERLPFADGSFDLVTCLDVVEHTPDDRVTLTELRRVTRAGGRLVVTVPAYQALWSAHDVVNGHFRRYDERALRSVARTAGWTVERTTHFNALLLPPAAAVRLLRRGARPGRSELSLTPPQLDGPLELLLAAEAQLVAHGLRIPLGLSLLAVLR
jgi:glycosyltransferase involved in cell wall biosynthesis